MLFWEEICKHNEINAVQYLTSLFDLWLEAVLLVNISQMHLSMR